ncbi:MAG TPA: hypothetical protein VKT54_11945 [Steroidobacteraceae bacterium]|nr:hypothetical protein [Steroidobacteraceae bacterium]
MYERTRGAAFGTPALALCSILAISPALAADFPSGTYAVKQAPYTLSFDAQGQFHVQQGKTLEVSGTYSVKAGEVQLTDKSGPWACAKAGEETGTYAWKYASGALTFTKVADRCEDRVKSLVNLSWERQK